MKRTAMAVAFITLLLLAGSALAHSGGGYELSWYTVDGGGALDLAGRPEPSGPEYSLGGTAGQPDAGLLAAEA